MCVAGLKETDGEDYPISDHKAGTQSIWEGVHFRVTDPSLMIIITV